MWSGRIKPFEDQPERSLVIQQFKFDLKLAVVSVLAFAFSSYFGSPDLGAISAAMIGWWRMWKVMLPVSKNGQEYSPDHYGVRGDEFSLFRKLPTQSFFCFTLYVLCGFLLTTYFQHSVLCNFTQFDSFQLASMQTLENTAQEFYICGNSVSIYQFLNRVILISLIIIAPSILWFVLIISRSHALQEKTFLTPKNGLNILEFYHFMVFASLLLFLFSAVFFLYGGEVRKTYGFRGSLFSFHVSEHYTNYVWIIASIIMFYLGLINLLKFGANYVFCLLRALT